MLHLTVKRRGQSGSGEVTVAQPVKPSSNSPELIPNQGQ